MTDTADTKGTVVDGLGALADMPGVTVVEIGADGQVSGFGADPPLAQLFAPRPPAVPVPLNADGTKNYAALPHMDLDTVPEGGTEEGWAEYLQIVAALPEPVAVEALSPMAMDLVMAHGVDAEDAIAAIADFYRRARDKYPDAKLPDDLTAAVEAYAAQTE